MGVVMSWDWDQSRSRRWWRPQWAGDGGADFECTRWSRWLPGVTGWGNRTCEVVVTGGKGQVVDRRGYGVLPLWPFAGEDGK
jgi:hypothetical protein